MTTLMWVLNREQRTEGLFLPPVGIGTGSQVLWGGFDGRGGREGVL
jgi:hypothetical protein